MGMGFRQRNARALRAGPERNMPSKTPKQAKFMRAVAHGWQPPGRHVDVGVAKEFMHADEAKKKGHRSKEQRAERKRHIDAWAEGRRATYAKPE